MERSPEIPSGSAQRPRLCSLGDGIHGREGAPHGPAAVRAARRDVTPKQAKDLHGPLWARRAAGRGAGAGAGEDALHLESLIDAAIGKGRKKRGQAGGRELSERLAVAADLRLRAQDRARAPPRHACSASCLDVRLRLRQWRSPVVCEAYEQRRRHRIGLSKDPAGLRRARKELRPPACDLAECRAYRRRRRQQRQAVTVAAAAAAGENEVRGKGRDEGNGERRSSVTAGCMFTASAGASVCETNERGKEASRP